jgi:hypothetical protein
MGRGDIELETGHQKVKRKDASPLTLPESPQLLSSTKSRNSLSMDIIDD